jgi:DNA-binding MarR family transcriptional regulator
MTQLIARLQDAGLVDRAADPADGRVVQVRITADGQVMLAGRRAVRAERLAGLLDRLGPDEREALAAALPALDDLANAQRAEPVMAGR